MGSNILALDVGQVRIGVAIASGIARLPRPLTTLDAVGSSERIAEIVKTEDIGQIVIGLPRNLSGDDTVQTTFTREFSAQLESVVHIPIALQDEAGTSVKAEDELRSRKKPYTKGDIDALAATYILEDYLVSHVAGSTA